MNDTKYKSVEEMGYPSDDVAAINSIFNGNLDILDALFGFMTQQKLTAEEQGLIDQLKQNGKSTVELIKRYFLPSIARHKPFHQAAELWGWIDYKQMEEELYNDVVGLNKGIAYIEQQLDLLAGTKKTAKIKFSSLIETGDKGIDEAVQDIKTRNFIMKAVGTGLTTIYKLAGTKQETPDEAKARILANSTK